jgi:hypothetical protein
MDSGLFLLAGFYLVFLMLGTAFFIQTSQSLSMKWKIGKHTVNLIRFILYILVIPGGLAFVTAVYLFYNGILDLM